MSDHDIAQHVLDYVKQTPWVPIAYNPLPGYRNGTCVAIAISTIPPMPGKEWQIGAYQLILRDKDILLTDHIGFTADGYGVDLLYPGDPLFLEAMKNVIRQKGICPRDALLRILSAMVSETGV